MHLTFDAFEPFGFTHHLLGISELSRPASASRRVASPFNTVMLFLGASVARRAEGVSLDELNSKSSMSEKNSDSLANAHIFLGRGDMIG
jgi:hypothetical protein